MSKNQLFQFVNVENDFPSDDYADGRHRERPDWERGETELVAKSGMNGKFGRIYFLYHLLETDHTKIKHDGILRAERGGVITLTEDAEGRFLLENRIRPQTILSDEEWKANFDAGVVDDTTLGRWSYGAPRNYSQAGKALNEQAKEIVEKKTNIPMIEMSHLLWGNDNTALSPHLTEVKLITVDTERLQKNTEAYKSMIQGEFFNEEQTLKLVEDGDLIDFMTLGAMAPVLLRRLIPLREENADLQIRVAQLEEELRQLKSESENKGEEE